MIIYCERCGRNHEDSYVCSSITTANTDQPIPTRLYTLADLQAAQEEIIRACAEVGKQMQEDKSLRCKDCGNVSK